ncbi:MAG TPA: PAS domain S-box protein, partial [Candidatus Manganitrophaceae bacterium]
MKDKDKNKEQLLKELKTLQTRLSELQRLGVEHKRAETRFRALLEAAPDPIIIVDDQGRMMFANAQTERLFGYDRDELLGEPIEILIPERFRKPHIGHRNDYFSMPRIRPMGACFDLAARRKDGSEFPVEISLSPLETEEGTLTISVVRDITDRKRAEGELRIQKGLLEEKVREMDDFIHVVSHDLKEPLRGIEAFAGFLQEDYASLLDEQGRRYIHFVKSSAVRMKDLIHDLLALASISRKGPVLQRTDLNQVLAHVEHDLGFAIQQKKAEIRLLSPLPEVVVDATQIGEVFKNLLSNAIKFNASI